MAVRGGHVCTVTEPKTPVFGFVFLLVVLDVCPVEGQLLHDALQWITANPLPRIDTLVGDTRPCNAVSLSGAYSELVRAEETLGGKRVRSQQACAYRSDAVWRVAGQRWGARVHVENDGFSGSVRDWDAGLGADIAQDVSSVGGALWGRGRYLSAGAALAAVLSDVVPGYGDVHSALPDHPLLYFSADTSLSYALFIQGSWRGLSLRVRRSRSTVAASLPRIGLLDSEHFRTFPLAAAVGESFASLAYAGSRFSGELSAGLERMASYECVPADNEMTTVTEWLLRVLAADVRARVGTVQLNLACSARFGGGYLEGYGKGLKYLVVDSADIIHLGGEAEARFSRWFRAGVFGDYVHAFSPTGYLNAAPFTAWSIFRPTAYKLRDMAMEAYELGGRIGASLGLGRRHRFELDLSASRLSASLMYSRLERRVVVLIPVYADSTRVTVVWKGLDLGIRFAHDIRIGNVSVRYWVSQHLPLRTGATSSDTSATGADGEALDDRFGGGTTAGAALEVAIRRRCGRQPPAGRR